MPSLDSPPTRKRVAVVGAGISGMSAAWAMSLAPDKFDVVLFERASECGGMATSTDIAPGIYGASTTASYINGGVQGASPVFYNTFKVWEMLGFSSASIGMQVSFGKSPEEFWTNVFPTVALERFEADIRKFGRVLKIIKYAEPIFALLSVRTMLKLFRFQDQFGETIVYPLTALFFGTGNQTAEVSSAILARVFNDENMRLFEFDPKSFLASIPSMRAFPRLSLIYSTWARSMETAGVKIRTSTEVVSIERNPRDLHASGGGVRIRYRATKGVGLDQMVVEGADAEPDVELFDEIIFACDASAALKLLGTGATWMEKRVLGNVKYLWDVSVTHSDTEYMQKYYNITYDPAMRSTKRMDDEAQKQYAFAAESFDPLYFIRSYPSDKSKVEMSFDLTQYQPQFNGYDEYGRKTAASDDSNSEKREYKHLYQTIFLDRDSAEHLWTRDEIKKDEIVHEEWWKQQSHRVGHYRSTVPWMLFINGKHRTHFAGAWTILNMHEIGFCSGTAAAHQLGAPYPFVDDLKAKRLFSLVMLLSFGSRMRSKDRSGFLA